MFSPKASETTPLAPTPRIEDKVGKFFEAYSLSPTSTFNDDGIVTDYDPWRLASFRVLVAYKATVLTDPVLLFEQIVLTLIFLIGACPSYILQSRTLGIISQGSRQDAHESLVNQETNIRKFSLIMTMLAAFLLALYTSIMIGRWWTMRAQGVGAIKAASSELQLYISQFVTKEEVVLNAIRRYARASLQLIFMWRQGKLAGSNEDKAKAMKEELVKRGILTDEEVELLANRTYGHNLYESIWTWQVNIVHVLNENGLIQSHELLMFLLEKCSQGRGGVQILCTHLSTKVPMQYVHLLGFIVKLHNIICALLMGILFSRALKDRSAIVCIQLYGRTLLMPFLFNAILLINAALADPFGQISGAFPGRSYDKGFENDGKSFLEAGANMPNWLKNRHEKWLAATKK